MKMLSRSIRITIWNIDISNYHLDKIDVDSIIHFLFLELFHKIIF